MGCRRFDGGAPTATWTTTTKGSRWPPRQGTLVVSALPPPPDHPGPGRCLKSTHSAPRQHPTALHGRKFRRCIPKPYSPLDYGCSLMSARRKRGCANRPSDGIDRISPGLEDRGLCFWKGAKCRCTNGPDTPVESGITASRCIQATLCIANPPSTPLLNSHSGPCLAPGEE